MSANSTLVYTKKKDKIDLSLFVPVGYAEASVKGSVWKINRLLNVLRGLTVKQAFEFVRLCPFGCTSDVSKILKSAVANAYNKNSIENLASLHIVDIFSNQFLVLRRMKAASKGKGSPRKKPYSKVKITLAVKQNV